MAEAARELMEDAPEPVQPRRFNTPDIRDKALWVLPRLKAAFPDKQDAYLLGWLSQLSGSNEFMVLNTPNAVGAAQRVFDGLSAVPTLIERFVLVRDKKNEAHILEAAEMYQMMATWGFNLGATEFVVDRLTDVPKEIIQEKIGRLLVRQSMYAKLTK